MPVHVAGWVGIIYQAPKVSGEKRWVGGANPAYAGANDFTMMMSR